MRKDLPYVFSVPEKWYSRGKKDEGNVLKASRSFSLLHPSNNKAVLLIHGYTGYPGELVRPSEELFEAGFDVFVPRLPGHGTCAGDFLQTGKDEWLGVARTAAEDLLSRYDDVSLLGHSMGGTICSILLSENSRIKKGVLACPAYSIIGLDRKSVGFLKLISPFRKKIRKEWTNDPGYRMHYEDAPCDDEALGAEYWSYLFPRQLLSLDKLTHEACASVLKIKSPTLIIEGGNDGVVDNSYTDSVTSPNKNIRRTSVPDATHFIYYDKIQGCEDRAVSITLDFLLL